MGYRYASSARGLLVDLPLFSVLIPPFSDGKIQCDEWSAAVAYAEGHTSFVPSVVGVARGLISRLALDIWVSDSESRDLPCLLLPDLYEKKEGEGSPAPFLSLLVILAPPRLITNCRGITGASGTPRKQEKGGMGLESGLRRFLALPLSRIAG